MSVCGQVKKAILRRLWFKIIIAFCAGLLICLHSYSRSSLFASTNVTYNYALASQGKYPNGTRLNVYDIVSEPILKKAILQVGLENTLSWQNLADMMAVEAVQTRIPEDAYIATEYSVSLQMEEPLGGVSARSLLDKVVSVYFSSFNTLYAGNQYVFEATDTNFDGADYREIQAKFKTKCGLMASYVSSRMKENNTFVSKQTGETFSSLSQRINDFSTITLEKYSAYITNYGLSGDYNTFQSEMEYRLAYAHHVYDKFMNQYNVRLAAIDAYQPEQSAIVMIPTQDKNKEFYMSKTKIGTDYLSDVAVEYMEKAKNQLSTINMLNELLDNAKNNLSKRTGLLATANAITQTLLSELKNLETMVLKTDNDYMATELSNLLIRSDYVPSDTLQYGVKNAFIVFMGTFVILVSISWFTERHRNRPPNCGHNQVKKHA